jgi:hypothetical protein
MKNINRSARKKRIIISALTVAGLAGIYLLVAWNKNLIPFSNTNRTYEPGEEIVNMKRTDSEKKASEALEKDPSSKMENAQTDTPETPDTNSSSGKQEANVLVTNAGVFNGKVSASGFATNVVESTGTCEYVFTNGNTRIVKQSEPLPNSTSTTCKTVSFSADELSGSGLWKVYLHYISDISEGTSPIKEFQK